MGTYVGNVVLNTAFNIASGVIVDTHVARVARRMGLSKERKPERIEEDLMRLVPQGEWTFFGPAMVLHGRRTCLAKAPKCVSCALATTCEKILEADASELAIPVPNKQAREKK